MCNNLLLAESPSYDTLLIVKDLGLLTYPLLKFDDYKQTTIFFNIMHNNFYFTKPNLLTLRSNAVTSNIDMRGHSLGLFTSQCNVNFVKYLLFYCAVKIWNSLPSFIVISPNCYIFN